MSQDPIPYETACRIVGRLYLESQYQLEQVHAQAARSLVDLQQRHAQQQERLRELEARLHDGRGA